jgi:hypothetical protein
MRADSVARPYSAGTTEMAMAHLPKNQRLLNPCPMIAPMCHFATLVSGAPDVRPEALAEQAEREPAGRPRA